jgi:hypothetical protein
VKFVGGLNGVAEGFAFDNMKVSESPQNDLAMENILYPQNTCGLTVSDSVIVRIKNYGMAAQHGFEVKCSIDGGLNYVTETIPDTLAFLETMNYKFVAPMDFSLPGLHQIVVLTNITGDQNTANDTLKMEIMNYPILNTFPYNEGFESNNGYWYSEGIHNSWEWGVPADTVLTSAASGTHCWATNLTGYHNLAERSTVTGPCIDFANMHNPELKMKVWYSEENPTYCQVKISTNGGANYSTLGSASDNNWYNAGYSWTYNSFGWKQVVHTLKSYAGMHDVRLQFYFEGAVQRKGFAFDDITICDAPVAGFNEIIPVKGFHVTFQNTSTNMDSCRWFFGDGSTSKVLNPVHPYPNGDSVLVKLICYNSCWVDSVSKYVHPAAVGITEDKWNSCVNFYPNPANNEVNMELKGDLGECAIEISNIQGKPIYQQKIMVNGNYSNIISLNNVANGIYFVKINTPLGVINRKLIKN